MNLYHVKEYVPNRAKFRVTGDRFLLLVQTQIATCICSQGQRALILACGINQMVLSTLTGPSCFAKSNAVLSWNKPNTE